MKHLKFIFPVLILLISFACSKDGDTLKMSFVTEEPSQEEIDELIAKNKEDFEALMQTQFGSDRIIVVNGSIDTEKNALELLENGYTERATVLGPYTGKMYEEKILTKYKMVVTSQPGLATGIYFCDVYRYYKEITLPSKAITGWVNYVTPEGFSNFMNQTPGYGYTQQSGNSILKIYTYKIHVRYNVLGQTINKVYPMHLNNVGSVNYSYSYLIP